MIADGSQALYLITIPGSVTFGPTTRDREERVWVERAWAGDEAGYRWLLDRYRDRVVRLAAATLGGTAEAEDAAQETFIRAFRQIRSLESQSSFYSWVCRIAIRVCLDQKRLKRSQEVLLDTSDPGGVCEDHSSTTSNTLLVWQILNQLPPNMRAALILRELDGLEYEEIARMLVIPTGTVRSRLNSARARFKMLWEEANNEEPTHGCT
jgi:RNA polymerase sigma-70 factor, ECF subfamily